MWVHKNVNFPLKSVVSVNLLLRFNWFSAPRLTEHWARLASFYFFSRTRGSAECLHKMLLHGEGLEAEQPRADAEGRWVGTRQSSKLLQKLGNPLIFQHIIMSRRRKCLGLSAHL